MLASDDVYTIFFSLMLFAPGLSALVPTPLSWTYKSMILLENFNVHDENDGVV